MMRKLSLAAGALAASAAAAALAPAPALSVELKFASFVGGRHVMNREVFAPWAERIAAMSKGALTVKMYYGGALGKGPAKQFKRAVDGVADLAWGLQGYTSKQFRRTTMVEMTEVGANPADATRRLWKVFDAHLAPEYARVKVIALWAADAPILHSKRKRIASVADLDGMKIRAPSQIQAKLVAALGATPLAMPVTKVYNALDRGVIDGVLIPPSTINNFKLDEVTKFHTGGIPWGRSPFFAVMNRKSYDSLSADHRRIVDETSGLALSVKAAEIYAADGMKGLQKVKADKNQVYADLSAAEAAKALALLKKAERKILADIAGEGVPAAEALAAMRGAGM